MRKFNDLSVQEVLALAIRVEKNNAERLKSFLELYSDYDQSLYSYFHQLYLEELDHKKLLEQKWLSLFGELLLPEIDEESVREVVEAFDVINGEHAIFDDLTVGQVMSIIQEMENAAYLFYLKAAAAVEDMEIKNLLSELARFEHQHIENIPQFKLGNKQ